MTSNYWKSNTFKIFFHQIPKRSKPYLVLRNFSGPGKIEIFFEHFQGSCNQSVSQTVNKWINQWCKQTFIQDHNKNQDFFYQNQLFLES